MSGSSSTTMCTEKQGQVSRITEAAAKCGSSSSSSGDVVGGELDSISISNETETSDAQRERW